MWISAQQHVAATHVFARSGDRPRLPQCRRPPGCLAVTAARGTGQREAEADDGRAIGPRRPLIRGRGSAAASLETSVDPIVSNNPASTGFPVLATSTAPAGLAVRTYFALPGSGSGGAEAAAPRRKRRPHESAPALRKTRPAPTRTVPISAESTWPAGVRLRSVGEALLGAVSSLAQAGSDDANHTAAASARTRGADRLPCRSLTGRACMIVVQAFPVG